MEVAFKGKLVDANTAMGIVAVPRLGCPPAERMCGATGNWIAHRQAKENPATPKPAEEPLPKPHAQALPGTASSHPPAAPPPKEAAKPVIPQRIRVGGPVQQAKLIRQPKPIYPPLAKQARISGVVRLNAIIGKDGTIQNLTVAGGHPLLVPAAMEAVKQWVYAPTLVDGEPVEVVTQIDVNFVVTQ
jgi:TonB family protein